MAKSVNDSASRPEVVSPESRAGAACDARALTRAAKAVIGVMRVLIMAGLALCAFLSLATHGGAVVPMCGDCVSALASHWSKVGGVPVALLGLVAYLLLFVATIRFPRCPWSRASGSFFVSALAGGGAWFIGIQAFGMHQWCAWCTATHAISIALAAIIWPMAMRRSSPPLITLVIVAGLACAGVLASAQYASRPPAAELITRPGAGPFPQSPPKLDLGGHIVIGPRHATQYVIEAMDFRCHRCAAAWPVVENASRLLGGKVAVIVLPTPLCSDCNHYISHTPEGFELSCDLAKLAWAVWLADADQYPPYHQWLLSHQQCTADEAKAQARTMVGGKLDAALADPRIDANIHRDVELAAKYNLELLPAMLAGRLRISAIPDDPQALAMLWTTGLADPRPQPNVPQK